MRRRRAHTNRPQRLTDQIRQGQRLCCPRWSVCVCLVFFITHFLHSHAQLLKPDVSRICKLKFSIPFFNKRKATINDVLLEHIQYLLLFSSVEN